MRKIPPEYENPIDHVLLQMCDSFIKPLRKFNITPNMITISRILLSFSVLHTFYISCNILYPIVGSAVFYFMDCLDGHLARGSGQVTVLGDYLDHFGDIFYDIIYIYILFTKNFEHKYKIIILFFSFLYLMLVHLGLQQKNYAKIVKDEDVRNNISIETFIDKEHEETLDFINYIHPFKENDIYWSRYFGMGSFVAFKLGLIYWIQSQCL